MGMIKPMKVGLEDPQEDLHRIRITLSSKSVKNLEKGMQFHYNLFIMLAISLSLSLDTHTHTHTYISWV